MFKKEQTNKKNHIYNKINSHAFFHKYVSCNKPFLHPIYNLELYHISIKTIDLWKEKENKKATNKYYKILFYKIIF